MASSTMPKVVCSGVIGEEVVEHHAGDGVALQLDDDPHPAPVGLVADVGDALDPLVPHQLGDLLDQPGLVDLVGDLGDDDGSRGPSLSGSRFSCRARRVICPRPVS